MAWFRLKEKEKSLRQPRWWAGSPDRERIGSTSLRTYRCHPVRSDAPFPAYRTAARCKREIPTVSSNNGSGGRNLLLHPPGDSACRVCLTTAEDIAIGPKSLPCARHVHSFFLPDRNASPDKLAEQILLEASIS